MIFNRYQSVKRLGTTEVSGIEDGTCYIFPKIDGTNASVYAGDISGVVKAGSRNRELSLDNDNAGFYEWVLNQDKFEKFMIDTKGDLILYGEWLVPHSLKTYREDTWRDFYVFDVVEVIDGSVKYWKYDDYKELLDRYEINYIPPVKIITNPSYDDIVFQAKENNTFLVENGKGVGEGVVVKNYDFVNKYGRTTWAKFITSEFKEIHYKEMGAPESIKKVIEEEIAREFVTKALVDKTYAKIENENEGFDSKDIPRLLNTVFYDVVNEDTWEFIKKHKNPIIDFRRLMSFCHSETKKHLPLIF